jgi:hypothetical protein
MEPEGTFYRVQKNPPLIQTNTVHAFTPIIFILSCRVWLGLLSDLFPVDFPL